MNKDVKEKWLAALRSGEYTQGVSRLSRGGQYCCLGVLCDLAVKDGVIPQPTVRIEKNSDIDYKTGEPLSGSREVLCYDGNASLLPNSVEAWAELGDAIGIIGSPRVRIDDSGPTALSYLNDNLRWDFLKIADIVEEQL